MACGCSMPSSRPTTKADAAPEAIRVARVDFYHLTRDGAALTHSAFGKIPWIGPTVLTVGLITFVFSTILGWSYYGEKAMEYLFGTKSILPYRVLWVILVMVGSVVTLDMVWAFADIANGLMALPNLISLIVLSGVIVAETRKYLWEADKQSVAAENS